MPASLSCLLANLFIGQSFWILWPLGLALAQREGWSPLVSGILASSTWATCLVVLPFAHGFATRFGHRRLILVSQAMHCIACLGYAAVTPNWLWGWAVLLGASLGLRWPTLDAWTIETTPTKSRGRLVGIVEAVAGLPLAIGPALNVVSGVGNVQVLAGISMMLAFLSLSSIWYIKPPLQVLAPLEPLPDRRVFLHRPVLETIVLAAALCGGLFESGFMASGPLIALGQGLSIEKGLWVSVMVGIGSVTMPIQLGWGADRFGAMNTMSLCAAGLTLSFLLLSVFPPTLIVLSGIIGGFGGGLYTLAVIRCMEKNVTQRTSAIGAAAATSTLGSLLSPVFTGSMMETFGPGGAVYLMTSLSGALCIGLFLFSSSNETDHRCSLKL